MQKKRKQEELVPCNKRQRICKELSSDIVNMDLWNKLQHPDNTTLRRNDEWISPSKTGNYIMKDTLSDWLELYHRKNGFNEGLNATKSNKSKNNFNVHNNTNNDSDEFVLFSKGNYFEEKVCNDLRKDHDTITISTTTRNRKQVHETLKAMKDGIPIIMQATLANETNKTWGIADLLVRSDYINKLFKTPVVIDENYKAPILNGNYHYVVIDIKWSSLSLMTNKKNICNSAFFPKYKAQLAIYNLALGTLQGYIPNTAYIMGKSWKCNNKAKEHGNSCDDLLGEITFDDRDKQHIENTAHAVRWARSVKKNGHRWSCNPPSVDELRPNMCSQNPKFMNIKTELALKNKEITMIYGISYNDRNIALKNNITRWDDPKCTTKNLQITSKNASLIDKILNLNRNPTKLIEPKRIVNNLNNWHKESELDFYIDFETVGSCLTETNSNMNINNSVNDTIIFMMGVGHKINGEFKYEYFMQENLTATNEEKMINNFMNYITEISNKVNAVNKNKKKTIIIPRLFHWTHAEEVNIMQANRKFNNILSKFQINTIRVDIHKIFHNEPIVIKDCLNYKLKTVAGAMQKHSMIKTKYDCGISNGKNAMFIACDYYKNKNKNSDIKNKIVAYNKIDCKILYEILEYLRLNHI